MTQPVLALTDQDGAAGAHCCLNTKAPARLDLVAGWTLRRPDLPVVSVSRAQDLDSHLIHSGVILTDVPQHLDANSVHDGLILADVP